VTEITDREWRLRQRIDLLTDQRDKAWADLEQARKMRDRYRKRAANLQEQLDFWKARARGERWRVLQDRKKAAA
jgi:hypothetical protein